MGELFEILKLGKIKEIKRVESSQNKVFEVITDKGNYIVKRYSKDAINEKKDLDRRIKQIEISEKFRKNGINVILPLKFGNNYFVKYIEDYYLIYEYFDYKILEDEELNLNNIKILAENLAKMHKSNINEDVEWQYKKINIDYEMCLNSFEKINDKLYECLKNNIEQLILLTKDCNDFDDLLDNFCISHNDYKLKNILWDDEDMYLIDFDACALANPYVALAEAAYSLSRQNGVINLDFYELFLKSYLDIYQCDTDFRKALKVAMNGKLQWLEYMINKLLNNDLIMINDIISLIKEVILYKNNINYFYNIYLNLDK